MSIAFKVEARTVYRCDVCRREGRWDDNWSWYGSIMLEDVCPEELPHVCSDECRAIGKANIDSGKWKLPTLTQGMNPRVTKPKSGYGEATTNRAELARERGVKRERPMQMVADHG